MLGFVTKPKPAGRCGEGVKRLVVPALAVTKRLHRVESRTLSLKGGTTNLFRRAVVLSLLGGILWGTLLHARPAFAEEPVTTPQTVELRHQDRVVAVYNVAFQPSPKTESPWFGRSGFLHPFFTPSGAIVTSGFPPEHEHQHGLMFAWTSTRIDGKPIDFWNSAKRDARVEHHEILASSPTELRVRIRHIDQTVDPEEVIIDEVWEIQTVDVDEASVNVLDLVSAQRITCSRKVTVAQYHYGAMCVRGPDPWMDGRAAMRTDQWSFLPGESREEGNHSRPKYVILHGKLEGKPCGIAAISHPRNFRAPQPVRLHPRDPYFCFAPMVLGDFELSPESSGSSGARTPYVSAFRFIAFDGAPPMDVIENLAKDFSNRSLEAVEK